jgi:hypothetical protein
MEVSSRVFHVALLNLPLPRRDFSAVEEIPGLKMVFTRSIANPFGKEVHHRGLQIRGPSL